MDELIKITLTKASTESQIKLYFEKILELKQSNEDFPINLDEVWALVYTEKGTAVRALKRNFIKNDDFITVDQNVNGGKFAETIYKLSICCLEYFIARKVRPVFEVYRQVFHKSTSIKAANIDFSDPETVLMLAQNWKEERQKRIEAENATAKKDEIIEIQHETINELAPKAEYAEKVLTSKDTFTATQLAKEFGFAAQTLNQKLKELRVQYKHGGQWLLYAKYQNKGYVKTNTYTEDIGGETRTWHSTVWTEKGRSFIHDLLSKNKPL